MIGFLLGNTPFKTLKLSPFLTVHIWPFLYQWCLSDKEFTWQCKRFRFNPWVEEIPWRRKWQPTPAFLPGKSHGQRSLVGYSAWGHKGVRQDSSITQQLPMVEGQLASTIAASYAYCHWTLGLHRHYQTIKKISFSFFFIGKDWVSFPVNIVIHCPVIFITAWSKYLYLLPPFHSSSWPMDQLIS